MYGEEKFEVYHNGVLVASLSIDVFSSNEELLAVLRKTHLFSGRKAEFSGSIRDQLDIQTSQGLFSLKNVSQKWKSQTSSPQTSYFSEYLFLEFS
jgi:hypothetical protein